MKLQSAYFFAAPLSIALALGACSQSEPSVTEPGKEASTATATNDHPSPTEVTGAGSSFVYPLISKWSADYNAATGNKVNYQSIGSGGGIAQIKAGTVDFGSSDKPLDSAELKAAGLAQFPSTIGGVVPVVNLAGIAAGQMHLTGPVLADIFLGRIVQWNDPAIAKLNPGLKLPNSKIAVVHRSDGSGTTFNFSAYLSAISSNWKQKVGEGTAIQFPVGVGGKGNEGVASFVQNIKGSIGYVEMAYALQNKMIYTGLQNASGHWVLPSTETFAAAAESADWAHVSDFNLVMVNAPGEKSWPITASNFMLVPKHAKDPAHNQAVLSFFKWGLEHGQEQAQTLNYVPLPASLVQQVENYWAQTIH